MGTPRIGLLPDFETVLDGELVLVRTYVNEAYVEAVLAAGGNPLVLPFVPDEERLQETVGSLDGLLVTGGRDVDPSAYGEEPLPEAGTFHPVRDRQDLRAVRFAAERGLPVLGVCRGLQLLNVAYGGTLHQDLPACTGSRLKHRHRTAGDVGAHRVRFTSGSRMERIFGPETRTNSYHHAAVKDLASAFVATGFADDGTVEAVEPRGGPLVFGVQWHPELMFASSPPHLDLFRMLVAAAKGG